MDYRKLNAATKKDHFPLPFIDQMLDRLAGNEFFCFLDGYSGYNQIMIWKTKRRQHLHVFMVHSHFDACRLDYVTPQAPFSGV